jgi:hypothetical protein
MATIAGAAPRQRAGSALRSASASITAASNSATATAKAIRYAADDPKGGGVAHGARIFAQPTCHHRPDVLGGIGEAESAALLKRFFEDRRG